MMALKCYYLESYFKRAGVSGRKEPNWCLKKLQDQIHFKLSAFLIP